MLSVVKSIMEKKDEKGREMKTVLKVYWRVIEKKIIWFDVTWNLLMKSFWTLI